MKEQSNNLRFENDEPPVSPSSVKVSYVHCGENEGEKQPSWTPYYTQDEELRNNLKSVIKSNMNIDEKIDLILALCQRQ